ncbi:phytanoyl-CoA dioxygenase family protein [bacterium]|nr:MAG: phytanoyl-CoA dioxygenase family protein [bacterium]
MSTTTLPNLDSPYELTQESLAHYREHGWVLLRDVLSSDEIATYRRVILDATMRFNSETRPMEERDTYGKAFLQVMNLWTVDDAVKPYTLSKRLAGIAAALLVVDRVRLYHDQALFKEPGGGHTPWHQDQFYWPLDAPETVTLWMPMVDVDETMGSMSFADGSQRSGFVPVENEISDASESFFDDHVRDRGYPIRTSGAMRAGDATFHSGWTLHRAPGNSTDRVREVMTVIYYPDGTRVKAPSNDFQSADLKVWLGSKTPGELADGPLNPRL